jgi:hypothetical protein
MEGQAVTVAMIQFLLDHNKAILWTMIIAFAILGLFVPHFWSFLIGYLMSGALCLVLTVDVVANAYEAGRKAAKQEMLKESFR